MNVSDTLKNYIKARENPAIYKTADNSTTLFQPIEDDYAGTPNVIEYSIGYGHQIQPTESYLWKGITKKQADALFDTDIKYFSGQVAKLVKVPISQKQFNALVSLGYGIGIGALGSSALLKAINSGSDADTIYSLWEKTGIYWHGANQPQLIALRRMEATQFTNEIKKHNHKPVLIAGLGILFLFGFTFGLDALSTKKHK